MTKPRVKDLGWPGAVQQGRRARSFGGLLSYTVAYYGGSEPDSGVVFRWAREGGAWSEAFFSYEGAIRAAQADYERRILSALEDELDTHPAPQPSGPVKVAIVDHPKTSLSALTAGKPEQAVPSGQSFQERVQPWMMACFGPEISADKLERSDRFIEEALELVQAGDYPKERVLALVDYVYGRDQGDINQEVGGVMVTLAAHCLAHGVDMHEAGEAELARIWNKVEKIRAKQAAKPTGSALPVAAPAAGGGDD